MKRLALSALLLAIVVVWGWTFALMKDAVAAYGVVAFLAVRYVIGSAAIAPFAARRADWRTLEAGGLIGLVLAAAYLLQTFGLRHTTASNTGVITGLFVVFVPLANRALFGLRTPGLVWATIAASLVGLGLLSGAAPGGLALGDVLTVGAAACFGLHVALLGRYASRYDAGALAFGQLLAATLVFLAACPLAGLPTWPTPAIWFALAVTGVVATAAGFYVQTYVQQRLPAVQAAMIILLEPLFAALFGYLLAGDRLTGVQIAGALLITGSVAVAEVYPLVRRGRAVPA